MSSEPKPSIPAGKGTTRERVAEMRAAERRRERQAAVLRWGGASLAVAVAAAGAFFLVGRHDGGAGPAASAEGVRTFEIATRDHVQTAVDYPQTPPVGGDHAPAWQNCGVYSAPVENENAVHSLEHGAVWLSYRDDLPAEQVDRLRDLVQGKPFVLLSPHTEVADTAVASAWGKQLVVSDVADPRLSSFIREHAQSPKAPEPGAPCTGGIGSPDA